MSFVHLFLACAFCYSCSFLFVVFVCVFFFCSHWSLVDVPLIFFCPADHVPDWQPRIFLGMVDARSVNVKNTTTVQYRDSFKPSRDGLFFFFFNLTYSRWTSSLPSCLWSQRIFPSLPGSRLTIFLSRCKFSTLTTRQPIVELNLLTFPRFPLRKKEHKSYFGQNRTHDFRTSRCAGYLLDHSGIIFNTVYLVAKANTCN